MARSSPLFRPPTALSLAVFLLFTLLPAIPQPAAAAASEPAPAPWPDQFHAVLFMNFSGQLSLIDLWYDWTNGRNFNIIRDQLSNSLFYDLEWNNGTSFFYRLDRGHEECRSAQLEVGILRPNWLDNATYLGQSMVNGFLCNAWTKVDFIWYFEDVATKRPVKWVFYTGREANVMVYEEGAFLEDAKWQAPSYCFTKNETVDGQKPDLAMIGISEGKSLMRGVLRGSLNQ